MTIDELARRAGTTTRNIRNYQTLGILPPPAVVGRVGYYDEGHVGRLRLIGRLQDQGFSLAGIRELVQAWEQGRSLGALLGFEQVLAAPWVDEETEELTLEQLLELFPEAATDPALGRRAVELGMIEPRGDRFRVPSPTLLRAGAEMVAAGVPLAALHDEVELLRGEMERIAARFVDLFERYVWQPFVDAGMPSERLSQVTESLRRMRPVASTAVRSILAEALEQRSAASTAVQAKLIAETGSGPGQEAQG